MIRGTVTGCKALLHSGLIAGMVGHAGLAWAGDPDNAQLQREIDELREAVRELRGELANRKASGNAGSVTAAALHDAAAAGAEDSAPVALDGIAPVGAHDAPEPEGGAFATREEVDGLRASLENYKYDQQRLQETTLASTTRSTVIGGTVQTRYTSQTPGVTSGAPGTSESRNSSFDIPLAQLFLTGSLYRDYSEGRNLTYKLGFAYVPNVSSGSSIGGSAPGGSQFNAQDVYLQYSFLPTTFGQETPALTATFGQQLIPFGLEAQTDESLRPVINSAQFVSGLGVGTRQIGLVLRGDYGISVDYAANYRAALVSYALGVVNGGGPNHSDDNNHKDWTARLAFTVPVSYASWLRQLTFGTSAYVGRKNLLDGSAVARTGRSNRYGFDIYYNHAPFGITAEYALGLDDTLTGERGTSTLRSYGWYVTGFYTWGEQWVASYRSQAKYDDWWPKSYQAFARYERWNPNTGLPNRLVSVATLGLNVFFAQTTKFQFDLAHTSASATTKSSNAILAQFQFGF